MPDPLILRLHEPTAPVARTDTSDPAEPTAPTARIGTSGSAKPTAPNYRTDTVNPAEPTTAASEGTNVSASRHEPAAQARTERDYLGPTGLIRDLSGALRTRLYRRRRAAGKIVVRVTIDEVGAAAELMAKGWLDPRDQDDRRAIGAALERATIKIMPRDTRHATPDPDQAHSLANWSEDEPSCKS